MDCDEKKSLIKFYAKRQNTNLAKNCLNILEELISDGYNIPEDKFKSYRKRILDSLGNNNREMEDFIDKIIE